MSPAHLPAFLQRLAGDDARRMLGNSAWLLGARLAAIPIGIAQSVLTARLLGIESYGVLAIVIVFVATLNQLTSFRMNEFLVKHVSDAQAAGRRDLAAATVKVALLAEAGASLVSFAVVWATAGLAASWFVGEAEAASLVRLYAIFVLGNL
ncbi:MAG: lipopolysaccharide biosynthesis protein, partial [Thermoanaerobaculia bacterium]